MTSKAKVRATGDGQTVTVMGDSEGESEGDSEDSKLIKMSW